MKVLSLWIALMSANVAFAQNPYYLGVKQPVAGGGEDSVTVTVSADDRDAYKYDSAQGIEDFGFDDGGTFQVFLGNPDGTLEYTGFQFQLDLPQGTTVVRAFLTLTTVSVYGTPSGNSVTIHVYDVDNSTAYDETHTHTPVAHHTVSGTTVTGWTATWAAGAHTSPDIGSLVQVPLNRVGWSSGNYIGLALTPVSWGSGDEVGFYDRGEGTASVASLKVVYEIP